MATAYEWRGAFESREVDALHSEAFDHDVVEDFDWHKQARDHSLGWVCAREDGELVGFVNVAWDGAEHAFILDTMVAKRAGRRGVGTELVSIAVTQARAAGCEWLQGEARSGRSRRKNRLGSGSAAPTPNLTT